MRLRENGRKKTAGKFDSQPLKFVVMSEITRPGLEPGMAGPKPAVLPITPPGTRRIVIA